MKRTERGMLSTELAVLMPVFVIVALVAVHAVQVQRHGSTAQAAADSAARAASLAASEAEAVPTAQAAARRVCPDATLSIDSWLPPEAGALRPGRVVVSVVCRQSYRGFAVLGSVAERAVSAVGVSTIEYWRSS